MMKDLDQLAIQVKLGGCTVVEILEDIWGYIGIWNN
jgi:hypothetical protein